MKVSTKGRYALRLMTDLAVHDKGEPVRVRDIAKRQEISAKYLEQIVSVLVKAGYVKSVRGAQGGYLLTKKPEEYLAGDILRLTEGTLALVPCLEREGKSCPRAGGCSAMLFWRKLDEAMRSVVDGYTLADLAAWEKKTEEKNRAF